MNTNDSDIIAQPKPSAQPTYMTLGYLGLLPFALPLWVIVTASLSERGVHSAAILGLYAPYAFIAYSACILSFLAGSLWRDHIGSQGVGSVLLVSNLLALMAWVCLMVTQVSQLLTLLAIAVLMSGFLTLLWAEQATIAADHNYTIMRFKLTALVVAMHMILLACLLGDF